MILAHDGTGKVAKEAAPGFTLAGFSRCFSWHFKPIKMIAGDVHLKRHQDRKLGNFLLQLLVLSDLDVSGRKTCKNDDDDDEKKNAQKSNQHVCAPHYSYHYNVPSFAKSFAPLKGSCYCSRWYRVIDLEGVKS